jgi:hypothetical protein
MIRRTIRAHLDDRGPRFTNRWEDWHGTEVKCPYGKVCDILRVRETWLYNDDINVLYDYKADYNQDAEDHLKGLLKPSIFMPREGCRVFLKITYIRVERLQDTSEEYAIAQALEGMEVNETGN